MSLHPHYPPSPLPDDIPLDVPPIYGSDLHLRMQAEPTKDYQLRVQGFVPHDSRPSSCDPQYPWVAPHLSYDYSILSSPRESWDMRQGQNIMTWLHSPSLDCDRAGTYTVSPTLPAYHLDQNIHAVSNPSHAPWAAFSGLRSPQLPDGKTSTLRLQLDPPNPPSSSAIPTNTKDFPYHFSQLPVLPQISPYHFFTPNSVHFGPYPTSIGFPLTDPQPIPAFYGIPSRKFTGSSQRHRRNDTYTITYDGLCFDEEELLKGLMEPDGKVTVHPCHWETDHSPCPLWIRSDESCINAHIRKWHRGQSGQDKSRVECRWSACGATMRKDSIARHIVTVHFGEVWECQGCGKTLGRGDVYREHARKSHFDACRALGALIAYACGAREINAHAALQNGRKERCGL